MILTVGFLAGLLTLYPSPSSPAPSPSATNQGMRTLIVYGSGWMFYAHEPDGWTGYTEGSAAIGSNLYYLHSGETLAQNGSLIRVSILQKQDNAVDLDLAADMDRFRKKDPAIQFIDFSADYPGGFVYAKIYRLVQGDQYVAYVDPGPKVQDYFIVSYDPPVGQQASQSDLNAYRAAIKSLACCTSRI